MSSVFDWQAEPWRHQYIIHAYAGTHKMFSCIQYASQYRGIQIIVQLNQMNATLTFINGCNQPVQVDKVTQFTLVPSSRWVSCLVPQPIELLYFFFPSFLSSHHFNTIRDGGLPMTFTLDIIKHKRHHSCTWLHYNAGEKIDPKGLEIIVSYPECRWIFFLFFFQPTSFDCFASECLQRSLKPWKN